MTSERSAALLQAVVSRRDPIDLAAVLASARLQTRVDRKYLLTPGQFAALAERLHDGFRVLDIDDRRMHGYESVYFDTPGLECYRHHRQGRRRRFKVRTRAYTDTDEQLLEVKLEGPRGSTDKRRLPLPNGSIGREPARLDTHGWSFVAAVLDEYGVAVPSRLEQSLVTTYRRTTLVDPLAGARLTLDVDLEFSHGAHRVRGPDRVLVESKSTGSSLADDTLADLGIRPASLSKYCVGLAVTRPDVPANRWSRLLRQEFGWQRAAMVDTGIPA